MDICRRNLDFFTWSSGFCLRMATPIHHRIVKYSTSMTLTTWFCEYIVFHISRWKTVYSVLYAQGINDLCMSCKKSIQQINWWGLCLDFISSLSQALRNCELIIYIYIYVCHICIFSRNVHSISDRIWCNKNIRLTITENMMTMGRMDTSDLMMIITWTIDISFQSLKLK